MPFSRAQASKAVEAFVASVAESLSEGERVALTGFGTWTVETRAARLGRNPRTGERIPIPETKAIKFKASIGLSKAVQ